MAEHVLLVCDVCGKPAADTVAITARDKPYRKDLCSEHLAELLLGARTPKRGRPSGRRSTAQTAPPAKTPRRRGRSLGARTGSSAATRTAAKGSTRPRRRITDPVVLEKRRAALAKARAARAAKRAAAQTSAG
jgi:hypothetical protein